MSALHPPLRPTPEAAGRPRVAVPPVGAEHLHLSNASWAFLTQLLHENPERRMRLSYADGNLHIMSPLPMHESWKELVDTLIKDLCTELDIPRRSMGSTTWLGESARRGIEADESYYIASEPLVRGKTEFDLSRDPPPDLVVEIDVTHSPVDRPAIYAALGVPELWVFDGHSMTFLRLIDGRYEAIAHSDSFPFVTPADVERHLAMLGDTDETTIAKSWRRFVSERRPHR